MKRSRLGCLSPIAVLTALATSLAIGGYALAHGGGMFSPGDLSAREGAPLGGVASHAAIGDDCAACHVSPLAAMRMGDRCIGCHRNIAMEIADPGSLHGKLGKRVEVMACRACHPDHRGHAAELTDLDPRSFPHGALGFSLNRHQWLGSGQPFECRDCHVDGSFIGFDQQTCSQCHLGMDQAFVLAHRLAFGPTCTGCHDGIESLGRSFDHNKAAFRLTGGHADVDCAACHIEAHDRVALETTPQDCASCHIKEEPHAGRLGTSCDACHNTDGWKPAKFDHALAEFKLTGEHAKVACAECHKNSVLQGTPTACVACHEKDDKHAGQFTSDCGSCHTADGWERATVDHNQFAFRLVDAHAAVACENCHVGGVFVGTPQTCKGCHTSDDPHKGQFAEDCSACHRVTTWAEVHVDHNAFAFKLTGAHVGIDCAKCHVNGTYANTPQACGGCHSMDDAHRGQLGTDCAQCHTTAAWKPATFDHNRAAFKLTGAHASVPCTACHTGSAFGGASQDCNGCHSKADAHSGQLGSECALCHTTSAWKPSTFNHDNAAFRLTGAHTGAACASCHANARFRGTPTDCWACHSRDDAHGGRFGTNCASCHSTSAWRPATFDHNLSNFPLTGAHANLECSRCHGNRVGPMPTSCVSCHSEPAYHAGMFAGQACSNCHTTSAWKPAPYNGPHGFPMSHGNAGSCSDCHRPNLTTWSCAVCHDQGKMDEHHKEVSGYDGNCLKCHPSGRKGD